MISSSANRRMLAGLGLLVLLLGAGGPSVAVGQRIGVGLGDSARTRVAPSGKLALPLMVDLSGAGSLTLASLQVAASWTADRLSLDSIRAVPASGVTLTANPSIGGVVFSVFRATALPASGPVAMLYLSAASTRGGTRVALVPSAAGTELGQGILSRVVSRPVDVCVVTAVRWGDASADGVVNILDAQQIARYAIGLPVPSPSSVAQRGDVTADGVVNVLDAQQVMRFELGLGAAERVNTESLDIPPVFSLGLAPLAPTVPVGGWLRLTADVRDAQGGSLAGCHPVSWSSASPGVATVDATGLVTSVAPGTSIVTATIQGRAFATTVSVVTASVASVVVSPATSELEVGGAVQLTATPRDSTGAALGGRAITWASSNTALATVSATGLVTGLAAGTVTITATSEGRSGTAALLVKPPPPGWVGLRLATPNVDDGGIRFTVAGATMDSVESNYPTVLFRREGPAQLRVIIIGPLGNGPLGRIRLADPKQASAVAVTIQEVAARGSFAQRPPSGYAVTVTP